MIRAVLDGNRILIRSDAADAAIVKTLPGAMRTAKMPPLTWQMPLNLDSITHLRDARARASTELVAKFKAMLAAQRYVEAQKQPGAAIPLQPIPVKPGTSLYNHQIKAYNIVLALYGYAPAQGGGVQ